MNLGELLSSHATNGENCAHRGLTPSPTERGTKLTHRHDTLSTHDSRHVNTDPTRIGSISADKKRSKPCARALDSHTIHIPAVSGSQHLSSRDNDLEAQTFDCGHPAHPPPPALARRVAPYVQYAAHCHTELPHVIWLRERSFLHSSRPGTANS